MDNGASVPQSLCKGSDFCKRVNMLLLEQVLYLYLNSQHLDQNKNHTLNTSGKKNSPPDQFLTEVLTFL